MENKYLVFLSQNLHDFLVYRLRLIISVISQFIAPLIMMLVLTNLPGKYISGMTKQQIISYYLFTSILFLFTNSNIDSFIKEAIQQGELAIYLIKPVKFWLVALVKDLSQRLIRLLIGIPIFVLLILIYSKSIPTIALTEFTLTIVTLILSFLLSFGLSFSIGLLAFFMEEVWGLQNVKNVAVVFLGGAVLPYYFFPATLQKVLIFTPFPYLVNWPLRKGFSGSITTEFIIVFAWLIFFMLFNINLWKKGLKKYSALGTY
jgi:ABC-2 type transport system permease protein